VESLNAARSKFAAKCRMPTTPVTIHPAITILQQLNAPTLLPTLTPELKGQLQTFLGAVKLNVSHVTHDAEWARCRMIVMECSRF
jgi:hypothetical protein